MAKNYQRRCCVSSHPLQLRWPKVFGRVESLDWRGLRDTSRSERDCAMDSSVPGRRSMDAHREAQFVVARSSSHGHRGGSDSFLAADGCAPPRLVLRATLQRKSCPTDVLWDNFPVARQD
jgi:hypothetical protein